MLISGEHSLPAPPDVVWRVLLDVDSLRNTVPGCKELKQTDEDTYTGAATVGIGVIKGLYKGSMRFLEREEPRYARIQVQAKSSHAEIKGEGKVTLEPSDGGTIFRYEGEAQISGPLAAVGQRLLPAASKSQIETFIRNIEEALKATSTQA